MSILDFSLLSIRNECVVPRPKVNYIPDSLVSAPQDFSAETARTLLTTLPAGPKASSLSHLSLQAFSATLARFKNEYEATKRPAVVAEI
jgi:hypothetical protein